MKQTAAAVTAAVMIAGSMLLGGCNSCYTKLEPKDPAGTSSWSVDKGGDIEGGTLLSKDTADPAADSITAGTNYEAACLTAAMRHDLPVENGKDKKPGKDNTFLLFFFWLKNTSKESKYLAAGNFSAEVDGKSCIPMQQISTVDGYESLLTKELRPGETVRGYVAFEISQNWQQAEILFKDPVKNGEVEAFSFDIKQSDMQ